LNNNVIFDKCTDFILGVGLVQKLRVYNKKLWSIMTNQISSIQRLTSIILKTKHRDGKNYYARAEKLKS